jgi:hypothetical protein
VARRRAPLAQTFINDEENTMKKTLATHPVVLSAVALSLTLAFGSARAQTAEAQLVKKLDDLAAELEKVKAELRQMKDKPAPAAPVAAPVAAAPSADSAGPATQITSYGELNYSHPRRDSSATTADVGRFVLGFQHRFDKRTKVVAELEVEHSVASSSDAGEVAVEQVYVEHKLNDTYGLRSGLFLMPIGLINQSHEPTSFYGVFRPVIDTAIIPTTLREIGVQAFGEHDNGVSWSAGISTGPDLTKWDPADAEVVESPLGAIHQEGQLAKAKGLTVFGAVDWRGIPGLRVGGGLMAGKIGHGAAGFAAPNARYTLWDLHAKWTPGQWDLSAVYARGSISGAGNLNATFSGAPYLVPKLFDGLFVQAAYKFALGGGYSVAPFARYERINTGRKFDGVVAGTNVDAYATEGITTIGANFNVTPEVVIKADYQRYKVVKDAERFNVGLGYSF